VGLLGFALEWSDVLRRDRNIGHRGFDHGSDSLSVRSKFAAYGILKRIRDESLLIAVTAASS
jgi:hypothetical protein